MNFVYVATITAAYINPNDRIETSSLASTRLLNSTSHASTSIPISAPLIVVCASTLYSPDCNPLFAGNPAVINELKGYDRWRFIVTCYHNGFELRSGSCMSLRTSQTLAQR